MPTDDMLLFEGRETQALGARVIEIMKASMEAGRSESAAKIAALEQRVAELEEFVEVETHLECDCDPGVGYRCRTCIARRLLEKKL